MSRERICQIAQQMLDERISLVDGCAAICKARVELADSDLQSECILPFIAFDSEMHGFATGEVRANWTEQALSRNDPRLQSILEGAKPELFDACRMLLDHWTPKH
jgi:hypothetical protein